MELEEMKTRWGALNDRLGQSEILNQRIIKEMVNNRTQSAYNKLFKYDLFGLILIIIGCILVPILNINTPLTLPSVLVLEGLLVLCLVAQSYLLSFWFGFDIETKSLYELSRLTLKYKLWLKRYCIGSILLTTVAVVLVMFLQEDKMFLDPWRYGIIAFALILGIYLTYIQVRLYKKNIIAIQKGLEELKEFKE